MQIRIKGSHRYMTAYLAATDDMPEFCEWFGRAVAGRLAGLESAQISQRYYDLAQLFKPDGGINGAENG
jgi:hypothetical protein